MHGKRQRITLIGAPSDVGAGRRGSAMGPEALRVAGIGPALERLGHQVTDSGNIQGPPNPEHGRVEGFRHAREVAAWCHALRDAVDAALADGSVPIALGGDHSLAIGSIAAVSRHCANEGRPLFVLWLDAHADFNDMESSPSGNLHGMPVAVLTGRGPDELLDLGHARPIVPPSRVIQIGVRSIDRIEKKKVLAAGLTVYDMRRIDELGMRQIMEQALAPAITGDAHLHVSLDVDFLDPAIAPGVPTTVPGGPSYREAQLCMEMISETGLVGSVDLMELNPACDDRNRTAVLAVELIESLFGEQILARAGDSKYDL